MIDDALYLTVVALIGIGLATVLRHTAGAISTLFELMLVLPILVRFLPSEWAANVNESLPSHARVRDLAAASEPGNLGPGTGFALFCGHHRSRYWSALRSYAPGTGDRLW